MLSVHTIVADPVRRCGPAPGFSASHWSEVGVNTESEELTQFVRQTGRHDRETRLKSQVG